MPSGQKKRKKQSQKAKKKLERESRKAAADRKQRKKYVMERKRARDSSKNMIEKTVKAVETAVEMTMASLAADSKNQLSNLKKDLEGRFDNADGFVIGHDNTSMVEHNTLKDQIANSTAVIQNAISRLHKTQTKSLGSDDDKNSNSDDNAAGTGTHFDEDAGITRMLESIAELKRSVQTTNISLASITGDKSKTHHQSSFQPAKEWENLAKLKSDNEFEGRQLFHADLMKPDLGYGDIQVNIDTGEQLLKETDIVAALDLKRKSFTNREEWCIYLRSIALSTQILDHKRLTMHMLQNAIVSYIFKMVKQDPNGESENSLIYHISTAGKRNVMCKQKPWKISTMGQYNIGTALVCFLHRHRNDKLLDCEGSLTKVRVMDTLDNDSDTCESIHSLPGLRIWKDKNICTPCQDPLKYAMRHVKHVHWFMTYTDIDLVRAKTFFRNKMTDVCCAQAITIQPVFFRILTRKLGKVFQQAMGDAASCDSLHKDHTEDFKFIHYNRNSPAVLNRMLRVIHNIAADKMSLFSRPVDAEWWPETMGERLAFFILSNQSFAMPILSALSDASRALRRRVLGLMWSSGVLSHIDKSLMERYRGQSATDLTNTIFQVIEKGAKSKDTVRKIMVPLADSLTGIIMSNLTGTEKNKMEMLQTWVFSSIIQDHVPLSFSLVNSTPGFKRVGVKLGEILFHLTQPLISFFKPKVDVKSFGNSAHMQTVIKEEMHVAVSESLRATFSSVLINEEAIDNSEFFQSMLDPTDEIVGYEDLEVVFPRLAIHGRIRKMAFAGMQAHKQGLNILAEMDSAASGAGY
jgi:hypothetical protein